MRTAALLCLLLVLGFSCASHQRAFRPPTTYQTWWAIAQDCAGTSASLFRLTWFEHKKARFQCGPWETRGCWYGSHAITLGRGATTDSTLVIHEMLHDLTDGAGHEHEAFKKCGV